MSFIRGTTPTLTLQIKSTEVNLHRAHSIYVTIEQTGVHIDLSGNDLQVVDKDTIECFLTQEQSLMLSSNSEKATMQINWTVYDDGGRLVRLATRKKTIDIESQLLGREI